MDYLFIRQDGGFILHHCIDESLINYDLFSGDSVIGVKITCSCLVGILANIPVWRQIRGLGWGDYIPNVRAKYDKLPKETFVLRGNTTGLVLAVRC